MAKSTTYSLKFEIHEAEQNLKSLKELNKSTFASAQKSIEELAASESKHSNQLKVTKQNIDELDAAIRNLNSQRDKNGNLTKEQNSELRKLNAEHREEIRALKRLRQEQKATESALSSKIRLQAESRKSINQQIRAQEQEVYSLSKKAQAEERANDVSKKGEAIRNSQWNAFVRHIRQLETMIVMYYGLSRAYDVTIGKGIDLNKTIESNSYGLAALYMTNTRLLDGTKELTDTQLHFKKALELSQGTMLKIKDASALTIATFPQLTEAFQQGIGYALKMGDAFGSSTEQITERTIEIATAITNMAGAVGMSQDLVQEEMRSLFSGDVTRDSKLAILLFGDPSTANKAIKDAGKNVDGVYNELIKRLEPFKQLAGIDTYAMNEAKAIAEFEKTMAEVAKPIFDDLSDAFIAVRGLLEDNREEIVAFGSSAYDSFKSLLSITDELLILFVGAKATKMLVNISSWAIESKKFSDELLTGINVASNSKNAYSNLGLAIAAMKKPIDTVKYALEALNAVIMRNPAAAAAIAVGTIATATAAAISAQGSEKITTPVGAQPTVTNVGSWSERERIEKNIKSYERLISYQKERGRVHDGLLKKYDEEKQKLDSIIKRQEQSKNKDEVRLQAKNEFPDIPIEALKHIQELENAYIELGKARKNTLDLKSTRGTEIGSDINTEIDSQNRIIEAQKKRVLEQKKAEDIIREINELDKEQLKLIDLQIKKEQEKQKYLIEYNKATITSFEQEENYLIQMQKNLEESGIKKTIPEILGEIEFTKMKENIIRATVNGLEQGIATGDFSSIGKSVAIEAAKGIGAAYGSEFGPTGALIGSAVASGFAQNILGGKEKKQELSLDEIAERKFQALIDAITNNTEAQLAQARGQTGQESVRQAADILKDLESQRARLAELESAPKLGALYTPGGITSGETLTQYELEQAKAYTNILITKLETEYTGALNRNIDTLASFVSQSDKAIISQKTLNEAIGKDSTLRKYNIDTIDEFLVALDEAAKKQEENNQRIALGLDLEEPLDELDNSILSIAGSAKDSIASLEGMGDVLSTIQEKIEIYNTSIANQSSVFENAMQSFYNTTQQAQANIDNIWGALLSPAENVDYQLERYRKERQDVIDIEKELIDSATGTFKEGLTAEDIAKYNREMQEYMQIGATAIEGIKTTYASSQPDLLNEIKSDMESRRDYAVKADDYYTLALENDKLIIGLLAELKASIDSGNLLSASQIIELEKITGNTQEAARTPEVIINELSAAALG